MKDIQYLLLVYKYLGIANNNNNNNNTGRITVLHTEYTFSKAQNTFFGGSNNMGRM